MASPFLVLGKYFVAGAAESANLGDNLPADTAAVLDKIGGVKGASKIRSSRLRLDRPVVWAGSLVTTPRSCKGSSFRPLVTSENTEPIAFDLGTIAKSGTW
eukprot:3695692-Amphidinium_carterae.1